MTSTRTVTPRGWIVLATTAALVLGVLGAILIVRGRASACTVQVGDRRVGLSRHEAETAATIVAAGRRRAAGPSRIAAAVSRTLHLANADSVAVTTALSGRARAALVCRYGGATTTESDRLGSDGLTHRAERVRTDLRLAFGGLPLGGFAPGGVHTGHMPGSAHYEGRAIDVFFRPINARDKVRGWALALYFVAAAARLQINTVIFDGEIWTAARAGEGWRTYRVSHADRSLATIRILEHRDHVHVDVAD